MNRLTKTLCALCLLSACSVSTPSVNRPSFDLPEIPTELKTCKPLKSIRERVEGLGKESKFVINGDPKQSDIGTGSGLMDAERRMKGVEGINSVLFTRQDVVRDDIVQDILARYDE